VREKRVAKSVHRTEKIAPRNWCLRTTISGVGEGKFCTRGEASNPREGAAMGLLPADKAVIRQKNDAVDIKALAQTPPILLTHHNPHMLPNRRGVPEKATARRLSEDPRYHSSMSL